MPATVDTGNSPIRFTGTGAASATSAAFTAPADALLVCCVEYDAATGNTDVMTLSDTGSLAWTNRVARVGQETTPGGMSQISTARTTSAVSRTVTVTIPAAAGTNRLSAKVYVVTGADVDGTPFDTVGANNEGGATTDQVTTTSLTPGATGLIFAADCDWNEAGSFDASSDLTQDTTTYAGAMSVCDGYKACTNGVAVTCNLNGSGSTGPWQHKWVQIIVREAAGAGVTAQRIIHRPFPVKPSASRFRSGRF